ncbi:hypothetical protein [Shimazuella kribbensis]|uniref:hypothetical protein n=1 Tax=Shimazuella kribbensis TaxID=139808 RepID=UPI000413647B|nr:hypothetical protein [Shimazuella kribbensis]
MSRPNETRISPIHWREVHEKPTFINIFQLFYTRLRYTYLMLEIKENTDGDWLLDRPATDTHTLKGEKIYSFTGAYGPVSITVFTAHPDQVTWNKDKVTCRNGIIFIDYPIEDRHLCFEINPSLEQVFLLHQGKVFFSITSRGFLFKELTEPFRFLRDELFIPEIERLKDRVLVRAFR